MALTNLNSFPSLVTKFRFMWKGEIHMVGCVTVKIKQFFVDKHAQLSEIINMSNTSACGSYSIFPGYQIRLLIGFSILLNRS